MKHLKRNSIIIGIIVVILLATSYFIFFTDENKLTTEEKKWISNNTNTVQNIRIINDVNIFGNLGKGAYYSFLEDLSSEYDLKLNNIIIGKEEQNEGVSLTVGNTVPEQALTFYEDHYVMITKTKEITTSRESITGKKIGLLKSYLEYVRSHLSDNNTFTSYNTEEELENAFEKGEINTLITPRIEFLDTLLKKNYWISYHFTDLKRTYYIYDKENSTFFQILKKYYQKWGDQLEKNIYQEERKIFQENLNITDSVLADLQKTSLIYGYQNNVPYEIYGDRTFGGILSEYIGAFAKFSNIDIEYNKYNNERKMKQDINKNKITFYFSYNTAINEGTNIDTNIPVSFSVFVHESNPITIESMNSLKKQKIYVEKDSYLRENLMAQGMNIETYEKDSLGDILKKKDAIIAMDKEVGNYLKKSLLKNYVSRYQYDLSTTYGIKSFGSETLNNLLTKYLNYLDNHTLIHKGIYNASITERKGSIMNSLAKYLLYGLIIVAVILFCIYRSSKRVKMQKKLTKEDKIRFMDQLTSLKNRNYLNENLSSWNKNTIYPQSVIMIDLNKVQEINDTLGYEEGDRQIKAAANILIKTQLDNTDIIRTNGNEFMIYLVGYTQKQITSYVHKLNKEFKNLPFKYGVCLTYSMIVDDLKSIEDAINECVEDIKKQKETKKEETK